MANLHFFYGTMGAAKSTKLIQDRYNFVQKGTTVYVIKPQTDRHNEPKITSRIGLECPAAIHKNIKVNDMLQQTESANAQVLFIDEIQFFKPVDIDNLVVLADMHDKMVFCYGLMVDVNEKLFPASQHLIEVGAKLHELPVSCQMPNCKSLANHHLRYTLNGTLIRGGDTVCVDNGCVKYMAVCRHCYDKAMGQRG